MEKILDENLIEIEPEIAKRLFETLSKEEISVILITQASSESSICFAIPQNSSEKAKQAANKEFKKENMTEYQYHVMDEDDIRIIKEEAKEEAKAEMAKEVVTLENEVEEQRKAAEEQRKVSIRKLITSNAHTPSEIADIMGIPVDEVLKINAEMDTQN